MIYFESNEFKPYSLKATFNAYGKPSFQYTNDRAYWESFVSKWWHHDNLSFQVVTLSDDQQSRLDTLNAIDYENKGLWPGEASQFVEFGVIMPDTDCPFLQPLIEQQKQITLAYFREIKRQELKASRDNVIAEPINNVSVGRVEDRENITGTIDNWEAMGLTDGIKWVMTDNTIEQLSKQALITIRDAYIARKMQAFGQYEQLIATMNQYQTVDEIMALEWN